MRKKNRKKQKKQENKSKNVLFSNVIKRYPFFPSPPTNKNKIKILVRINSYLSFFSFFFTFLHFTTMMNLKIVKDDYKIKYFCMINSDLHSYIKSYIYF